MSLSFDEKCIGHFCEEGVRQRATSLSNVKTSKLEVTVDGDVMTKVEDCII